MKQNKWLSYLLKYGCSVLVGVLLVWLALDQRDFSLDMPAMQKYLCICDAFTISGLFITLVGVLVWISAEGGLDGISFLLLNLFKRLIPGGRGNTDEKYADYIVRKSKNRIKGYGFLFIVGGVFLSVAIIYLILFFRVYTPSVPE